MGLVVVVSAKHLAPVVSVVLRVAKAARSAAASARLSNPAQTENFHGGSV